MQKLLILLCALTIPIGLSISSCVGDQTYVPKPRMYPKIEFPDKTVTTLDTSFCDFTFEYPSYAEFEQDRYFFEEAPIHPCWFNLQLTPFNGTLHCSYIPVQSRAHYDKLINESFRMVEEHNQKANFRKEEYIQNVNGVGGLHFSLGGEVATNMQFILTDTTQHFFRASLYFNAKVAPDSLRPIYQFVKEDIDNLIETFDWKS